MKRAIALSLFTTLIIATPHNSFAWGKQGHGMVAEIAFGFLSSNTKDSVTKYLGATTIEQASTWMDEVRSDHTYDYMKPWHYVNIEKGKQYVATKNDNIINALNTTISALEHREKLTNDEVKKDLMVIFHLVGDLHMPLHVGYEDDKGGNTVKVQYLGKFANLHWVWDTEIIESEKITVSDCLSQQKNISKAETLELKKLNIENWIAEPRSLLSYVYAFSDNSIDQSYVNKNKPIVETQLLIAGIRLSALLSDIFK